VGIGHPNAFCLLRSEGPSALSSSDYRGCRAVERCSSEGVGAQRAAAAHARENKIVRPFAFHVGSKLFDKEAWVERAVQAGGRRDALQLKGCLARLTNAVPAGGQVDMVDLHEVVVIGEAKRASR
jgi:hypothetical protein